MVKIPEILHLATAHSPDDPATLRQRRTPSAACGVQPPLVLFLDRANATVSIMAEAILRHWAQERVRAASAGDCASGKLNPYAIECLTAHGIATSGLRTKPWGEFFGLYGPPVRVLITLCDVYAANSNWRHDGVPTVKAHWPTPEPESVAGKEIDTRLVFEEAFETLHERIRQFLVLPLHRLSDPALAQELARIGGVA